MTANADQMDSHYTVWITTDPTCLDTDGLIDVVVLQDQVVGYRTDDNGVETPEWGSTGDPLFRAKTAVDATRADPWGDSLDIRAQAADLLEAAGWDVEGQWNLVPTGAIATVRPRVPAES
jgi:hypothetical protein